MAYQTAQDYQLGTLTTIDKQVASTCTLHQFPKLPETSQHPMHPRPHIYHVYSSVAAFQKAYTLHTHLFLQLAADSAWPAASVPAVFCFEQHPREQPLQT